MYCTVPLPRFTTSRYPFGVFASQVLKALYALYRKLRNTNIPIDLELKLFDAFVTPILMYASGICGYEKEADIEKINL